MDKKLSQNFLSDLNIFMTNYEKDKQETLHLYTDKSEFYIQYQFDALSLVEKHDDILRFSKNIYLDTRWPNLKSGLKDITHPKGSYTLFECLMVINICLHKIFNRSNYKYMAILGNFLDHFNKTAIDPDKMIAYAYFKHLSLVLFDNEDQIWDDIIYDMAKHGIR